MIDLELANKVGKLFRGPIEEAGYRIILSSDFVHLAKLADKLKHDVSPHFDPRYNTFFRREAFWVGIYKGDECVGYAAAKLQPVGDEGLIEYAKRYWSRVYKEGSTNKIKFAKWQMDRLNVRGNLVYSGAWFVTPEFAKKGLGKNLGKFIISYSFMEWRDADYFYIFMENKDVRSGLAASLELSDTIPNALQWESHPSQAKSDYWMIGMSASSYSDWAQAQILLSEKDQEA